MAILQIENLGFPWSTQDPFLFCVHHLDHYPQGNGSGGPKASLRGRSLGNDFVIKDGWRMYHGERIPGFPAHPHRGFETVTVVQRGLVDHADSLGAAGRYGGGDVQWMTAGAGVQHSEMFPLLNTQQDNTLELFQIWLNLPHKSKMVAPHFKMLWRETLLSHSSQDSQGKEIRIQQYAGNLGSIPGPTPTPNSWANLPENEVAIWTLSLDAEAAWELPEVSAGVNRSLYLYEGRDLLVAGEKLRCTQVGHVQTSEALALQNGAQAAKLLLLQGRPIGEPVVQYGPFVMTTRQEIQQTFAEYQQTRFGGWPWPHADQIHGLERGRFARHANGTVELPGEGLNR